jgi:glycosyltransferase involved in cell wall biosynthesis
MKILYHHRTQGLGAEGVHIASVVQAFLDLGHSVTVVSPSSVLGGVEWLEQFRIVSRAGGNKVEGRVSVLKWFAGHSPKIVFELAEIVYNFFAFFRLTKLLRSEKYDLVYERYAFYLLAGAFAAKQFNCAFTLEINEASGIKGRVRKQLMPGLCERFERKLLQMTTRGLVVSSFLGQMLIQNGLAPDRIRVTPNSFDLRRLSTIGDVESARLQLNSVGRMKIGFVGWFVEWDQLDKLIEVFSGLSVDFPEWDLLFIGDGPVMLELRAKATQFKIADRVTFTGKVAYADVLTIASIIDIAVFTHSNEFGSPVAMFELMALGKPIVCPKLGPFLDVHEPGETAQMFVPQEWDGLKHALEELMVAPEARTKLGEAGRRLLHQKFTWLENAKQALVAIDQK